MIVVYLTSLLFLVIGIKIKKIKAKKKGIKLAFICKVHYKVDLSIIDINFRLKKMILFMFSR
jgi:hypothetical protein